MLDDRAAAAKTIAAAVAKTAARSDKKAAQRECLVPDCSLTTRLVPAALGTPFNPEDSDQVDSDQVRNGDEGELIAFQSAAAPRK